MPLSSVQFHTHNPHKPTHMHTHTHTSHTHPSGVKEYRAYLEEGGEGHVIKSVMSVFSPNSLRLNTDIFYSLPPTHLPYPTPTPPLPQTQTYLEETAEGHAIKTVMSVLTPNSL